MKYVSASAAGRRRAAYRPVLEPLECRETPSANPVVSLSIQYEAENTVTLFGQVSDDSSVEGLTVNFTGQYTGSVSTDAAGHFSLTAPVCGLGSIQASTVDVEGLLSNVAEVTVASNAPVITQFSAVNQGGGNWELSGVVQDESPGGLMVQFGGLGSLLGQTATVNADGTFSLVALLGPMDEGWASAQTTDWWALGSNVAQTFVDQPNPPQISLNLTYESENRVTLWGQVNAEAPAGLTVSFGGQYSGTTVTDTSGSYSITVQPTGLGEIYASVTDAQGLISDSVAVTVTSDSPRITEFYATQIGGTIWRFYGTVQDEWTSGLTIHFGGLATLEGQTATVNADGTFSLSIELSQGEEGSVTAQTTDWWDLVSLLAEAQVQYV